MSDDQWSCDQTWQDKCGNELRMLQKPIEDMVAPSEGDLVPFFHENSVFVFYHGQNGRRTQVRTEGVLSDLSVQNGTCLLSITPAQETSPVMWRLEGLESTRLTVWRVNNCLDALQVNFDGTDGHVYMQVGGTTVAEIFESSWLDEEKVSGIEEAVVAFSSNVQGRDAKESDSNG